MKKVLIILSALIALPNNPLFAAGYNKPIEKPGLFEGVYIGAQVGADLGTTQTKVPLLRENTGHYDANGIIGGATIGMNHQWHSFLVGIEGDISATDISAQKHISNFAYKLETNWLATIRPRIGYSLGAFLPYVTAGLAIGDVNMSSPGNNNKFTLLSNKQTQYGWTIGGGLETAISSNLSLKAEYLYVRLADTSYTNSIGINYNTQFYENLLRLGINYRFF